MEARRLKLLLKIRQGVLKMLLDLLILCIDFQQCNGLIVVLAVTLVCSLKLIPVIKKHRSFGIYTNTVISNFLLRILNVLKVCVYIYIYPKIS